MADCSSPGSVERPDPKRLATHTPSGKAVVLPSGKTDRAGCDPADLYIESSKETKMNSAIESDSDSEEESAEIQMLENALHAARNGSEQAMEFLITMRMQGRLPPDLAESWDQMVGISLT